MKPPPDSSFHPGGSYALTWPLVLLAEVSSAFVLLALFGPAAAVLITTAAAEGSGGVRALLLRTVHWRIELRWHVVVLCLPFGLMLAVVALHIALGGNYEFRPGGSLVLSLLLGVLVIGEELGWRGFALPRLRRRHTALAASLILGVLWACWHLANATMPGFERYWDHFPAFALYTLALTVLFTWLAEHTAGSVLLAWLFHAAVNIVGAVLFIGDHGRQWWLSAVVFGLAALSVVPDLRARTSVPGTAPTQQRSLNPAQTEGNRS